MNRHALPGWVERVIVWRNNFPALVAESMGSKDAGFAHHAEFVSWWDGQEKQQHFPTAH